jgi:hypothetical protein
MSLSPQEDNYQKYMYFDLKLSLAILVAQLHLSKIFFFTTMYLIKYKLSN